MTNGESHKHEAAPTADKQPAQSTAKDGKPAAGTTGRSTGMKQTPAK